ncbi:MAG: hypothetical protein GF398_20245 [Chitinivibrionales bacterium]|nr:hypothetical protein [Chitinivibrionales bacterium]
MNTIYLARSTILTMGCILLIGCQSSPDKKTADKDRGDSLQIDQTGVQVDKHQNNEHDHSEHDHSEHDHSEHDHSEHDHSETEHADHEHEGHEADVHENRLARAHQGHSDELVVEISSQSAGMIGLTTGKASTSRITREIELPGEIGFNEDRLAHITPRFGGVVKRVNKRLGAYVKPGDVLAVVESNESLSKYNITEPIAGHIISKHATPGELQITLKPENERSSSLSKAGLIAALNDELSAYPGVQLSFTQPIQNLFDELLSGVRTQLAVKIYGEDLELLRRKSGEIRNAIADVHGLVDLASEQSYGQPQVQVVADRKACARYGVNVKAILELVELAVGGEVIDQVFLNTRRFGIHVRYTEQHRDNPQALENLLVESSQGFHVPLSQLATIKKVFGPIQINREHNQRRWTVSANVRGRDLGSVVSDVQRRIHNTVSLPPGCTFTRATGADDCTYHHSGTCATARITRHGIRSATPAGNSRRVRIAVLNISDPVSDSGSLWLVCKEGDTAVPVKSAKHV